LPLLLLLACPLMHIFMHHGHGGHGNHHESGPSTADTSKSVIPKSGDPS